MRRRLATSIIVVSFSAYRGDNPIVLYYYFEVISSNMLATAVFYLRQRL